MPNHTNQEEKNIISSLGNTTVNILSHVFNGIKDPADKQAAIRDQKKLLNKMLPLKVIKNS